MISREEFETIVKLAKQAGANVREYPDTMEMALVKGHSQVYIKLRQNDDGTPDVEEMNVVFRVSDITELAGILQGNAMKF